MSYYDRRATDHKASIMMGAAVVLDMEAQAWLFTLFLFNFKLKAIKRLLGAKDVGFDLVKVEKDWRAYLDLALRQA
jgi:hypothetical protein